MNKNKPGSKCKNILGYLQETKTNYMKKQIKVLKELIRM